MPQQSQTAQATAAVAGAESHIPSTTIGYTSEDFRREIQRVKRKRRIVAIVCIVVVLAIAAGIAALVSIVPNSLQTVTSNDMAPVLERGQTVLMERTSTPSQDDIVFYNDGNGEVQVRRVVATSGAWANVASDGTLAVSDTPPQDADSDQKSDAAIALRQVPEGSCFVMTDSESSAIEALYQAENYIPNDKIIGRATFKVWPLTNLGPVG